MFSYKCRIKGVFSLEWIYLHFREKILSDYTVLGNMSAENFWFQNKNEYRYKLFNACTSKWMIISKVLCIFHKKMKQLEEKIKFGYICSNQNCPPSVLKSVHTCILCKLFRLWFPSQWGFLGSVQQASPLLDSSHLRQIGSNQISHDRSYSVCGESIFAETNNCFNEEYVNI